jgi:hypothetical protein
MTLPSTRDQYEKLLRFLHDMEHDGNDQTDAADLVREPMTDLWYELTDAEQEEMQALSVSLHHTDPIGKP